jgi:hypothetical protein
MTFQSLPLTARTLVATEARLQRIYDAAKLGLKGDALALASGMLPTEFRRLCQMDPIAEMAELKGRADAEQALATVMMDAALAGDTKAALEVLRHRHDWTAAQKIEVSGSQAISIHVALEQAQARVDSFIINEAQERANAPGLLTNQPTGADDGYADFDTEAAKRVASLRP